MLKEAKIILPTDNSKPNLNRAHRRLEKVLLDTFGGFTVLEGKGGWLSDDGETFIEPVKIYFVAIEGILSIGDNNLLQIAKDTKELSGEQSVYVQLTSGKVVFV